MKYFTLRNVLSGLIILFVLGLMVILYYREPYTVHGVVLQHNVVGDKYGNIRYHTLIKEENGRVSEKEGINYYVVPVGHKVKIKYFKLNFNK